MPPPALILMYYSVMKVCCIALLMGASILSLLIMEDCLTEHDLQEYKDRVVAVFTVVLMLVVFLLG